jgi:ribosomal 30S subunit maturation factor RimM
MTDAEWNECAVVGRVARAHGNRGQVIVNPETDFVDDRFQAPRCGPAGAPASTGCA